MLLEETEAITDALKVRIGPLSGLAIDGKPVITWKAPKASTETDWQAVAAELGAPAEVIAKHTRAEKKSRRFLVKPQ